MKKLIGEIIKDNDVVRGAVEKTYTNKKNFFVALVNICEELQVGVPVWTTVEDKKLEQQGCVLITEEEGMLRICKG